MNSIPVVTKNILIINVLCFFGSVVAAKYGIDLNDLLGLHFFLASDFNPAQLITYMFMHAGFQHIFFNMFAVWMFGRTLEQVWGPKRFLFYYILCGIGAGLVQEGVQYIQYVTELVNYEGVNTGVAVIPMAEYLNLMTTVVKTNESFTCSHVAEDIAHRIDLNFVESDFFHFLFDSHDMSFFSAAFARNANQIAKELSHIILITHCSFVDFCVIHFFTLPICIKYYDVRVKRYFAPNLISYY